MNQKVFSEMTIGEIQKMCKEPDCAECQFYNQHGFGCFFDEYAFYLEKWTDENLKEFIKSETRVLPWLTDE